MCFPVYIIYLRTSTSPIDRLICLQIAIIYRVALQLAICLDSRLMPISKYESNSHP